MKTTPVTKLAALLTLSAGIALTGCTLQEDDDQIVPSIPESTEEGSQHDEIPYGVEDFTYVTEDGTTVQCIASSAERGLSCDWEGATRPSDIEDSAPDEDAKSE